MFKLIRCHLLLVMIVYGTMCCQVFAGDVAPTVDSSGTWAAIIQQNVIPVLGAFVMAILTLGIKWLGRKFKIDALVQENNFLERLAHQGITLAEERAAQFAGSKANLNSENKLAIATSHILAAMPKISEARAQAVIESLLAQISGVGATGTAAFTRDGSQTDPVPASPQP